jgi:hypothetical protein
MCSANSRVMEDGCKRCGAPTSVSGEYRGCQFCGFVESTLADDADEKRRLLNDCQANIPYYVQGLKANGCRREYEYRSPVWAMRGSR